MQAYPDPVRVVSVGKSVEDLLADPESKENYKYSVEFCGGTHTKNTSEARSFAIVGETGVGQGMHPARAAQPTKLRVILLLHRRLHLCSTAHPNCRIFIRGIRHGPFS